MLPKIHKNYDLKPYNTFSIAAKAKLFAKVDTIPQLQSLLTQNLHQENLFILGGGSNILFTKDFPGLVIHNAITGLELIKEDHEHIWLQVGAGIVWHSLVLHCVANNYGGIENLSLIPGTVGAAPIQNIGAYGCEFKDVFISLAALNIHTGKIETLTLIECEFGYRDSIFKNQAKGQYIILNVTIKLMKQPIFNLSYGAITTTLAEMQVTEISIKDVSNAVIKIRQSKLPDPAKIPNAGSFFKNPYLSTEQYQQLKQQHPDMPGFESESLSSQQSTNSSAKKVKVPAAWFIEKCGWKGSRQGKVGVHPQHALVLANYESGTGDEIWQLAQHIQQDVRNKFNVELMPEVNVI